MMKQLRLSGSGGQGVITAAIIFAEAAVSEGKQAVQSQSYGPEARGGASKAEVIISDNPIYHPKVINPDIVLAMTQQAADKYYGDLDKDNGLLIVDEDLVPNAPDFPDQHHHSLRLGAGIQHICPAAYIVLRDSLIAGGNLRTLIHHPDRLRPHFSTMLLPHLHHFSSFIFMSYLSLYTFIICHSTPKSSRMQKIYKGSSCFPT